MRENLTTGRIDLVVVQIIRRTDDGNKWLYVTFYIIVWFELEVFENVVYSIRTQLIYKYRKKY